MKTINICTRTAYWNACEMCDKMHDNNEIQFCEFGKLCHTQDKKHKCIGIMQVEANEK